MSGRLATYAELAELLDALPLLLRETRRARGLSLREAAEQTGVSFNTLSRFERRNGELLHGSAMAVLRWLDQPPREVPDA